MSIKDCRDEPADDAKSAGLASIRGGDFIGGIRAYVRFVSRKETSLSQVLNGIMGTFRKRRSRGPPPPAPFLNRVQDRLRIRSGDGFVQEGVWKVGLMPDHGDFAPCGTA